MARFVDDIIAAVDVHPSLSLIEKAVLKERITRPPAPDEIQRARDTVYVDQGSGWQDDPSEVAVAVVGQPVVIAPTPSPAASSAPSAEAPPAP